MKKLVFSMLAMAALVSCTSESDPIEEMKGDGPDKVEIRMKAAVGITSKAPVISNNSGILDAALTGIQFLKATDIKENPVWTTIDKVASTAEIATADLATGVITFDTPLYYNADKDLKSWLIGYYPEADNTFPSSTNPGKLQWTINGSQDILFTEVASGSKTTGNQIGNITFKHKLLQLQFKFKAETSAIAAWGKVTQIAVKTGTPGALTNLNTTLACTLPGTQADAFTWGTPGQLLAFKAIDTPLNYTDDVINASNTIELTADEKLGGYIMVEPLKQTADYKLVVTTENATNVEVPITLGGAPVEGSAYEVVLTFTSKGITPKATITEWVAVSGGSGTVE